jgi:dihydrofolate reductase
MTGRITIDLFTTLDGVAQAPGGPDEDTSNGFAWGGWQAPIEDELVGREVMAGIESMDALVLGRRTYDIFSDYWPRHATGDGEGVIGRKFDAIPKYVATRSDMALDWQHSHRLEGDAAAAVAALRETHDDIHVIGSVDFVHSLIAAEAYDELVLWTYPIVLGQGRKVFPEGMDARRLRLLKPAVTGDTGVVVLRYGPDGVPATGTMGE